MKYSSCEGDLLELEGDVEQRVLAGDLEHLVGGALDDRRPRVVVLVDAVAEALQPGLARLHLGDERLDVVVAADLLEHLDDRLVGPAVAGAVEGRGRRCGGDVGVGVGAADDPHGGGRAVLLVVGVEDEQHVEGPGQHRVGLVAGLGDLPHHRLEVLGEAEGVVRVDEGHALAEPVGAGGQRRHLGDQPGDLLQPDLGVVDVLRLGVEGGQAGHRGHQDAHRVGVVVEALEEPLADVLVDERVGGDLVDPGVELVPVGQLAVDQQVGDLEVGGPLGQLLDRVAPVAQDAGLAVELGDGALGGCGGAEGGSRNQMLGRSFDQAEASTPPLMIGTSIDSPVRLSVIVTDSGMTARLRPSPALVR